MGTAALAITALLYHLITVAVPHRRWIMQRESSKGSAGRRVVFQALLALLFSAGLSFLPESPAEAATLERVRGAGKIVLGFRVDARPFSYKDASGKAIGYSIALVGDGDRDGRGHRAGEQAVALEGPERLRQHLLADPGQPA